MEALTNPQKRKLKALAQRLEPLLRIGKQGVSDAFVSSLDTALEQRELVKIQFQELKEQRKEIAPRLAEQTRSHLIMQVGHVAVFYRQHPDPQRRKIKFDI